MWTVGIKLQWMVTIHIQSCMTLLDINQTIDQFVFGIWYISVKSTWALD